MPFLLDMLKYGSESVSTAVRATEAYGKAVPYLQEDTCKKEATLLGTSVAVSCRSSMRLRCWPLGSKTLCIRTTKQGWGEVRHHILSGGAAVTAAMSMPLRFV
jgi:hypothetical protein